MLFTTGRESPVGFPIVPLVQIASNSELFNMMEDDMDVNAGNELIDLVKRMAEGKQPSAEINQQDCLSIHTVGPAF
jgi:altronate dehydratase large subunit